MAASTSSASVELIIKNASCAADTEFRTTVPLASSVRELKEQLHRSHPSKPLVDEQKIIFAGKVLDDSEGLQTHMARHDTSVPITLHLVIRRASALISQPAQPRPAPPAPIPPPAPAPLPPAAEPVCAPPVTGHAGAQRDVHDVYTPYGSFRCTGYQYITQYVQGQPFVFTVPTLEPLWIALPAGAPLPPGAWLAPGVSPPGAYPVLTPTPVNAQPWRASMWQAELAPSDSPFAAGAAHDATHAAEPAAPPPAPPQAPAPPVAGDDAAQVAQRDAVQLALKLVLLVFMLGQDGDIERLLLLCTVAVAIFVVQTHNLAHLLPSFRAPAALGGGGGGGGEPRGAAADTGPGSTFRFWMACCVAFLSSLFPGYQLQPQPQPQPHVADGGGGGDGLYGAQGPAGMAGAAEVPGAPDVAGAEPAMRVDARDE